MHKKYAGLAVLALAAIGIGIWKLEAARDGVVMTTLHVGRNPVSIFQPAAPGRYPVVVIAHGFAGSQQLMQSFAFTFARNGYISVTFDFPGHGRNPQPLTGSITDADGATRTLTDDLRQVAGFARGLGDGRLAVLGHSMASDIVVRFAQSTPGVGATIAVSMFSPVVTATSPANLLVIVGDWEDRLKSEALRVLGLASAPQAPRVGVTVGDPAAGTGRRVIFSPHVEHVSVLFSETSMRESVRWLDQTFRIERRSPPLFADRGEYMLLLIAGVVLLALPLSTLLPQVSLPPVGAGRPWGRLWIPLAVPTIATPLLLRVLPTHFLPVLVGDYLAVHFGVYGLITLLCLSATRRPSAAVPASASAGRLALAAVAVIAFGFVGLVWPINRYVTSFMAGPERLTLIAAMLAGTLLYFLSDEWLTRGVGAARGAYAVSKVCFLVSLALAVALDLGRLFFLIIIVPVIVLFFLIYGLFSAWIYRRTGHPFVAGVGNAVAFAWAIGVTFPLLSG